MSDMTKRNDLAKYVRDYAVYPTTVINEDFTIEEALEFSGQRRALTHIEDWFITRQPNSRFLLS